MAMFAAETDAGTRVTRLPWLAGPPRAFGKTFKAHFAALRARRDTCTQTGYLFAVVDPFGGLQDTGTFTFGSPADSGGMLSFGRHSCADIHLDLDPTIALRHLVARLERNDAQAPRLTLFDLNSGQGLEVEGVGRCQTVRSDGALFVGVGAYQLFFLPLLSERPPWDDVDAVWATLAPGDVDDQRQANRHGPSPIEAHPLSLPHRPRHLHLVPSRPPRPGVSDAVTHITVIDGVLLAQPISASRDLHTAEPPTVLEISGPGGRDLIVLDPASLARGLLIGRYDRCDVHGGALGSADQVSRVHLLILRKSAEGSAPLVAFDVGSKGGTRVAGQKVREVELVAGITLELAAQVTVRLGRLVDRRVELSPQSQRPATC